MGQKVPARDPEEFRAEAEGKLADGTLILRTLVLLALLRDVIEATGEPEMQAEVLSDPDTGLALHTTIAHWRAILRGRVN